MEKMLKEVRFLKIYSLVLTAVFALFICMSFRSDIKKQRFQEIDVERINVIEKDGTLKLVISNGERQHPGMSEGHVFPARKRQPGLIFFNGTGDECGGLVYDANKKDGAGLVLSVDQYRDDQIMQLQYMQEIEGKEKHRTYGLKLWDRPDDNPSLYQVGRIIDSLKALKDEKIYQQEEERMLKAGVFGTERMFVGKTSKNDVGLFIRDSKGKTRIKIYVDKNNQTKFETFDENGQLLKQ
ncbi:MAG TPA: hypothetical protein VM802_18535 [Chitinophaga sp.]|uniref:hypothetical protein n=1 Tax=Chitinophaga sp. TaxID=1869181 RepID=UPI002BF53FEB|nr:hypothetical protein [Chitinophaga sp.]HVI46884.1 hypothetical protein [Chitinophaga sp.]